ncbi:glycosyltransferase family 2 protein [Companilactobacillus versmoldensis]|uniref:Glycosyltransferase n=1 Tax=Companilactobacillus versmoldensis DSM 14857 = KCTC 3814 TaxID=1423815 RepID=A0A0R1SD24_9LACO|nr:glycosyltransferase family 2 protein [Companilactobacillus versmoldensis]KRL67197.1 glycosyltransferase [Companilactobacillus versmoldensis DSM 14857 = KCTC 3814]
MLILKIILGISFFATLFTFILSIATYFFPVRKSTPDKFLSDYKVYILMPVLNESSVIKDTVEHFFNNSYYSYKNNVHLILIDDRSTDGSTDILKTLNQRFHNFHVIKRRFPVAQHGKGEALNAGIEFVKANNQWDPDKTIIGVIDADASMSIVDINKMVNVFDQDDDLAMAQSRVAMNRTNNWLESLQDFEFVVPNSLLQNMRNFFGNAAGAGNGQFFRLTALKKHNPWGSALLEDFEISTRILLKNQKTTFVPDVMVYQEPVSKIKDFIKQRARWAQGSLDCLFLLGRKTLTSNLSVWEKAEMLLFMCSTLLSLIIILTNIFSIVAIILGLTVVNYSAPWWMISMLLLGLALVIFSVIQYYRYIKISVAQAVGCILYFYVYMFLIIPIVMIAFTNFVTGRNHWEKTTHGLKESEN